MGTLDAYLVTFLQWLVKATLQGSLLVCLIMLIQATLRQRRRPGALLSLACSITPAVANRGRPRAL
jgi:hypothetical protein